VSEPRIFISAGEASGDLYGAELARELNRILPQAKMFGLAGPRMAEAGVEPIVEFDRLVVMGFVEVTARLPFFLRLRRQVNRLLAEDPPDLVIPIDYPGFNLRLTAAAHAAGVPVLYYIPPQLWAWRQERAKILAEGADRVAVVFPQEEPFLRDFGVEAVFVGHPLLGMLERPEPPGGAISALRIDPKRPILGLLPGSRPQEVRRLLKPFLKVADEVVSRRPDVQVLVAAAPHVPADLYAAVKYPVVADSLQVLSAATAVLTKSGTTTVQSALLETPLVIAHRAHPLTYRLARRLVRVDSVGMVNLLAGARFVPEYVQALPTDEIADSLMPLLDEESRERQEMIEGLRALRGLLGAPGAAARVAAMAAELLGQTG
jgi:lipid-A-disaccharide synthase